MSSDIGVDLNLAPIVYKRHDTLEDCEVFGNFAGDAGRRCS
jgi:hypothetical protein